MNIKPCEAISIIEKLLLLDNPLEIRTEMFNLLGWASSDDLTYMGWGSLGAGYRISFEHRDWYKYPRHRVIMGCNKSLGCAQPIESIKKMLLCIIICYRDFSETLPCISHKTGDVVENTPVLNIIHAHREPTN
jgi:hypothetical protein